jgi:enoyl-CoA hydratase/carnithine racemase
MYLPPGMTAVVQSKVSPQAFRDMALTAKRMDAASDGVKHQLVEFTAKEDELLQQTIAFALKLAPFGLDKENHGKIKQEMNRVAINSCLNMQLAPGVRGYYGPGRPRL